MANKTICMLSCLHDLFDDRIYWKEALSLKKAGYNVVHIGVGDDESDYISLEGIRIITVKNQRYKSRSLFTKTLITLFCLKKKFRPLFEKAIEIGADIYNIHDLQLISLAANINRILPNTKIVYSIHESYPDMIRDYNSKKGVPLFFISLYAVYIDYWEIRKSRNMHHLITFDDATYERFKNHFRAHNVSVIYNFSKLPPPPTTQVTKEYDLVYHGSITRQRGILTTIKALIILRQSIPNIRILLLGNIFDPALKKEIDSTIKANKLQENIYLVDAVPFERVHDYLAKCKIGLVTLLPIPKYHKNIPIKQFEYMASGLPIIGSNLPPIKSFVEKANAGIIVDSTKPEEVAKAIIKLLNDTVLYKKLQLNGIKASRELFNWDRMEKRMLMVYAHLLK